MKHSVFRSFSSVKIIIDSLKDLVTGRYGAEAVSGPIGMAGAVGDATKQGGSSLLFLFILITMNLGVFNLLPLPALDGGRIIFLLVELIIRRPVKKEFEQAVNTIGIMLLMALMLFVTFKDIINLF
jgi:regulator of sigma E protease